MIVSILSIILIVLAGLERIIYIKKNKDWDKVRLFIAVWIIILLFLISYFITDTAISVFYVFSSIITIISTSVINRRSDIKWFKYLSCIIGLPTMVYLFIKATQNMLISPSYIFLLLLTISWVLSYSYERKSTKNENIAFVIGVLLVGVVIFSYYKLSGYGDRIMIKQEIVSQKYLEEELDIHGLNVYTRSGSLRGEEAKIKAYNSSGTFIIMIYKNNEIISYDFKNRE